MGEVQRLRVAAGHRLFRTTQAGGNSNWGSLSSTVCAWEEEKKQLYSALWQVPGDPKP